MSQKQTMIALQLSYDKHLLLPFNEQGVAIANLITGAPLHGSSVHSYGGTVQFQPYTGDPIEISTVQMEMDLEGALREANDELTKARSAKYEADKTAKASIENLQGEMQTVRTAANEAIAASTEQLNLVMDHLRQLEPIETGVKRGESSTSKIRKLNAAVRAANEAIDSLRELAEDGEEGSGDQAEGFPASSGN